MNLQDSCLQQKTGSIFFSDVPARTRSKYTSANTRQIVEAQYSSGSTNTLTQARQHIYHDIRMMMNVAAISGDLAESSELTLLPYAILNSREITNIVIVHRHLG